MTLENSPKRTSADVLKEIQQLPEQYNEKLKQEGIDTPITAESYSSTQEKSENPIDTQELEKQERIKNIVSKIELVLEEERKNKEHLAQLLERKEDIKKQKLAFEEEELRPVTETPIDEVEEQEELTKEEKLKEVAQEHNRLVEELKKTSFLRFRKVSELRREILNLKEQYGSLRRELDSEMTPETTESETGVISILNRETDLLGNQKEEAMHLNDPSFTAGFSDNPSIDKLKEKLEEKGFEIIKDDSSEAMPSLQAVDEQGNKYTFFGEHKKFILFGALKYEVGFVSDKNRNSLFSKWHKDEVKNALKLGNYQHWISEGRMTARDAQIIIKQAGLKTPKDIERLANNE
jgi:hypothetical protein